jgi:hypothetical protein
MNYHYYVVFYNEDFDELFKVGLVGNSGQRRKLFRAFKQSPFHKRLNPTRITISK